MAQVFGTTGQANVEDGILYPALASLYVPSVDNPQAEDGLGLSLPWGGGPTARKTGDEDGYTLVGAGFAETTPSITGNAITYDVEGLVGPQGPQGPPGPPGSITSFRQQIFVPYGNADLDEVLAQLRSTWENSDTIVYASDATIHWDTSWESAGVGGGISGASINDSAISEDGAFMLIAHDGVVLVSTDTGGSWDSVLVGTGASKVSAAATGGKAIALDYDDSEYRRLWKTINSGANWTQIILS